MGDILGVPVNFMSKLYHEAEMTDKISKIMKNEFGYYVYLILQ
jgi:hypothetical protein